LGGGEGAAGGEVDDGFPAVPGTACGGGRPVDGVGHLGMRGGEFGAGAGHLVDRAGLGRVRHGPAGVVWVIGVAVQGVEGEVFPGVFEVILLPPAALIR
jgi:hypothetical protein